MNRFVKFALSLSVLAGILTVFPTALSGEVFYPGPGWTLDWSDEFDGDSVDTNKWNIETGTLGGGNMEQQYYTDTNAYVTNGSLVILTSRVKDIFLSSRLNTLDKYSVKFGKIVARIKMPEGKGLWPAFWMLGTNKSSINWPQCGEIDIAEMRGGAPKGDKVVLGSVHWYDTQHIYVTRNKDMDDNLSRAFHDYELEWDQNQIIFRVDGSEYHRVDITSSHMDAFRLPFYIILNVAIGGNFSRIYSPRGVTATFPQYTLVDWVRVYRKE
jgi:beta-glucanase (GH16 family)